MVFTIPVWISCCIRAELQRSKKLAEHWVHIDTGVKAYLEIPDGHCSINAGGAEFTTISFVYLINRHLAEKRERQL